jgi:signal transduction histidine kinase
MQFPLAPQGFHQRVSVDKNLPSLPLDPDAIEQAILNLLAITMKYSGVSRDIELRVAARDSNALIEVADHGLIWAFHACRRSQHKPGTHLHRALS